MKPLTVKELIEFLKQFDGELPVAYQMYSENCLLDTDSIAVCQLQSPRPDGWVGNKRPDKPTIDYLVFPGN